MYLAVSFPARPDSLLSGRIRGETAANTGDQIGQGDGRIGQDLEIDGDKLVVLGGPFAHVHVPQAELSAADLAPILHYSPRGPGDVYDVDGKHEVGVVGDAGRGGV